jgi:hypothetical protein
MSHKEEWIAIFWTFPLPEITDVPALLDAGQDLLAHISEVSNALFPQKHTPHSRDLPWWSQECSLACTALQSCHWWDWKHHSMVLHMTIRDAKWEWVNRMIEDPEVSILDLAKWRKGHHLWEIPPIANKSSLTHNPELMTSIFHSHFFNFLHDTSTPPSLIHHHNLETRP